MPARAVLTTRKITKDECVWLDADIPEGELLYICTKPTYGAVSCTGTAITRSEDGDYPFFELPNDSIRRVGVD